MAPAAATLAAGIALVELARGWRDTAAGGLGAAPRPIMVPATVLGLLLAAGALLLVRPARSGTARRVGCGVAAATAALGVLVLSQFAADLVAGVERGALVGGDAWWAQRPGPTTALGLAFLGVSLVALGAAGARVRRWAGRGASATLVVALMGLVGHAYDASRLYGLNRWGGTAVSTAIALGVLGVGTLFADRSHGVAAVSVSRSAGGRLLRRLTPVALLAPLLLGWLALAAQARGLVDAAFGTALLVVALIVVLLGVAVRLATALHAADAERERLLAGEREARAEAERRRHEVEQVTESRARLMRGFTHDVKNPLGAADGHAQLLEEGILGELAGRQRESVQRIRRALRASLGLIDELLELARAEAGQLELACVETDVGPIAREVAEDFRAQTSAAGIVLALRAPNGVRAVTDPMRLRQVLANLLSNAVKYAPNGRVTVSAELVPSGGPAPGAWVAVHVRDTGPGIPPDKRERIFQEFTRLEPAAQHGAGVGLAISRRIARLLGGDLTVDSEVGRGSTFTLWLPPPDSGRGACATTLEGAPEEDTDAPR